MSNKGIEISSTKGKVTVGSAEEAAAWIATHQPSHVSVDGEAIDYETDDSEGRILRRVQQALAGEEQG